MVAEAAALVSLVLALLADVDASLAFVVAVEALVAAFVADVAASDAFVVAVLALVLAADALDAAAVWAVVAVAASTMRSYFAELVFVVSGNEPEDVCAVLTIKMLFVPLSFTMSRTT